MDKKEKIITNTAHKTIIRHGKIGEALTEQEVKLFHELLNKIKKHDKGKQI